MMINSLFPRRLDLNASRAPRAERHFREVKEQYQKLDNQPGDGDSRPDYISFSIGKTSTDILIEGNTMVERFSGPDGSIQVSEYTLQSGQAKDDSRSCLERLSRGPEARISGLEVLANEEGQVAGQELQLDPSVRDFYTYGIAPKSKSTSAFVRLSSKFEKPPS